MINRNEKLLSMINTSLDELEKGNITLDDINYGYVSGMIDALAIVTGEDNQPDYLKFRLTKIESEGENK